MAVRVPIGRLAILLVGLAVLVVVLAAAPTASAQPSEPHPTPEAGTTPEPEPEAGPTPTPTPNPSPVAPGTGKSGAATEPISSTPAPEESCGGGLLNILHSISVECMTKKAVRTVFGLQKGSLVMKPILAWILEIPDYVETTQRGIGDAEWLSEAIAFALLSVVVTFAVLHYWAAGLTSQGGAGLVMEGVMRCTGAALFILAWPFVFTNAGNICNAVTRLLLPGHAIDASIAAMTAAAAAIGAFGGPGGSLILGIGVLVAFLALFITLALIKIGLLAGLLVAFIGMPIAVALWPIPSLSAPASYGVRFIGMVYSVVILWALAFKVYGSVNTQFVTWGSEAGSLDKLMLPLIGLAELGALLSMTKHATAMWNIAPRKGTAGSIATFAASNMISSRLNGGGGTGGAGGGRGGAALGAAMAVGRLLGRGGGGGASTSGGSGAGGGSGGRGSGVGTNGQGRGTPADGKGNGKGGGGANGGPQPRSATARRTVGADGLPERAPGQRGQDAAARARQAAMARRAAGAPGVATTRGAIKQIAAAEGGRYAAPLGGLLGPGHDDGATISRLSDFAAAPGLSVGTGEALERIIAAEPATRTEAFGTAAGPGPSAFDSPYLGPPQAAVSQPNPEV
jgi:hypothetical protein